MGIRTAGACALCFALAIAATSEAAIVIDFSSLAASGSGFVQMPSYSEDGFAFATSLDIFSSARTGATNSYAGSAALFNGRANGVTTLSRIDGGTFDFDSIDLSELNQGTSGIS